MYCKHCGKELNDWSEFCNACGTPVTRKSEETVVDSVGIQQEVVENRPNVGPYGYNIPIRNFKPGKDYTPIGMWGYFGYQFLFFIPVIGQVLAIILALGVSNNVNVTNFARSQFCIIILNGIMIAIVVAIVISAFA